MTKRTAKSLRDLELEVLRVQNEYETALYVETMPEYDPLYKYCFQSSSREIPAREQSIRAWLQAVANHMNLRAPGHGGFPNIPSLDSDKSIDLWLEYIINDLRKLAIKRKKRKKSI